MSKPYTYYIESPTHPTLLGRLRRAGTGLLLLCLVSLVLSACREQRRADGRVAITTTIAPAASLIQEIGGDLVSVTTLLPKGNNPENYEPSPRDIQALSESKGYFYIGDLGFERSWIDRIHTLQPELPLLRLDGGLTSAPHGHSHDGLVHDPHYWTSLRGLRAMTQAILSGLSAVDSTHRAQYVEGATRLGRGLDSLEGELRRQLQSLPSRSFVIYHPSLSEFASEWSLEQLVLEEDGKEPSPAHLEQVIRRARAAGVRVVFVQKEFESKLVHSIASELGAQTYEINPLDGDWRGELLRIARALSGATPSVAQGGASETVQPTAQGTTQGATPPSAQSPAVALGEGLPKNPTRESR